MSATALCDLPPRESLPGAEAVGVQVVAAHGNRQPPELGVSTEVWSPGQRNIHGSRLLDCVKVAITRGRERRSGLPSSDATGESARVTAAGRMDVQRDSERGVGRCDQQKREPFLGFCRNRDRPVQSTKQRPAVLRPNVVSNCKFAAPAPGFHHR